LQRSEIDYEGKKGYLQKFVLTSNNSCITTMATGTDRFADSPLHAAAFRGDIEGIKKLVDGGCAVDMPDSEETTALY
jgi:hypothetical protein